MKRFRILATLLIPLAICSMTHAKDTYPDSPLYSGTTIIAGDLSQNEFYIVAEKDAPKLKLALQEAAKNKTQERLNQELARQFIVANKKQYERQISMKTFAQQSAKPKPMLVKIAKQKTVVAKAAAHSFKPVVKPFVFAENKAQTAERLRSALQKKFINHNQKSENTSQGLAYYKKPHAFEPQQKLAKQNKNLLKKYVIKSVAFDRDHQLVLRETNRW